MTEVPKRFAGIEFKYIDHKYVGERYPFRIEIQPEQGEHFYCDLHVSIFNWDDMKRIWYDSYGFDTEEGELAMYGYIEHHLNEEIKLRINGIMEWIKWAQEK